VIPEDTAVMDMGDDEYVVNEDGKSTSMFTPAQKATPSLRNPVVAFRDVSSVLTEVCPLAIYDPTDGLAFGMVANRLDEVCKDKFKGKLDSRLMRATTHGYDEKVTNSCIMYHYLPVPVHHSPLVAILEKVKCPTFTDAISSMRQLLFLRIYYFKVDWDDAEHCKECEKAYHRIHGDATDTFFDKVDQVIAQKDTLGRQLTVNAFAAIFEEYMLARIRAVEWNILDMLSIPLSSRTGFLTPTITPLGSRLNQTQGATLRKSLVFYMKKRKEMYAGGLQILMKNKLLDVSKNGGNMDVDEEEGVARSCQADKLLVQMLESNFIQPSSAKYKGWICMSTLENYLDFLNVPK
jgi:hypothetical protein